MKSRIDRDVPKTAPTKIAAPTPMKGKLTAAAVKRVKAKADAILGGGC